LLAYPIVGVVAALNTPAEKTLTRLTGGCGVKIHNYSGEPLPLPSDLIVRMYVKDFNGRGEADVVYCRMG